MRPHRRHLLPVIAVALAATTAVVGVAATAAPKSNEPFVRGLAALERIGGTLPAVAAQHGMRDVVLQSLLLQDDTLAVDRHGNLAYFDEIAPEPEPVAVDPSPAEPDSSAAPPVTGPEFQLASLPGADLTIYLDFDGHVTTGTTWNTAYGQPTITSPPFDRDGNDSTWSSSELQIIADSWAIVAEDFAPWNVNVTTIDPGAEALRYSGGGDTQWGARVVVTKDTFASCGCGGHAYIGAFDDPEDEPTFVYNTSLVGVSEAISHEVGHMLYLAHDGTTTGSSYYVGHDGVGPGWAPIMGVGYYEEVSQWSRQEYTAANNTGSGANYGQGEDDIAIISNTSLGNIPRRLDDHGDDLAGATALSGASPSVDGVIEDRDDVDVFSFSTSGGAVSFTVATAALGPNLDAELTLLNGFGTVIASSNPVDQTGASLATTVGAGTYQVRVDGVGVGTPAASPPSGYTDYGSLGQYILSGTIAGVAPPDTTPPASPTGLTGSADHTGADLTWDANGEPDLAGYVVQRDGGSGWGDIETIVGTAHTDTTADPGDTSYRIVAIDTSGNRSTPSATITLNVPVVLVTHATGETAVLGTVTGTFAATGSIGGGVQRIVEEDATTKPSRRHDGLEHRWELPASSGGHQLTIHASVVDGGDADGGVRFEVSSDGVDWSPVVTVPGGGSVAGSYDIGQRTGTIHVRVIDTDRSSGQYGHDRVDVDLLEATGDDVVVPDPPASSVLAEVSTLEVAASQGQQRGGATVTVRDDRGDPVSGAVVTVRFTGDFVETASGTTGAGGTVTLATSASTRKPTYEVCVQSVAAALPYVPGDEGC